jgi:5-methyltetrahydrofolate--homocysteine methyltransferase
MADLEEATVLKLVQKRLDAGVDPTAILASCREGMTLVAKRYESNEYFISDLVMAGEVFRQAMNLLGSRLEAGSGSAQGKVVIGIVKGDTHDIGKDIVVGLLKASSYDVHDLGVDVPERSTPVVPAHDVSRPSGARFH